MFARICRRAFSASARGSAGTLFGATTSDSASATRSLGRCLRKSFVRNFPEDDLLGCFDFQTNVVPKRYIGTSAIKTTPVASQLKIASNADDYEVDPELVTRYVVRPAEVSDCGSILKLVRGLAEWEGNADQVEITEEDLKRDGFGERPCYQCVLLEAFEEDDVSSIIGYAMFSGGYCAWKGRTISWEDLFIHHDYRGKGLGAVLLHEVCKMGYFDGIKYVGGYVDFENERAKQWYEDVGFENLTEKHGYNIMSMEGERLHHYVHQHKPIEKLGRRGVRVSSLVRRN